MAVPSIRVFSHHTLDSKVTLQGNLRSRALLVNKFDTDPDYKSKTEETGHNNYREVILASNPQLGGTFSGKVLRLSGTFNGALSPMSALHKSLLPMLTADNDHGFETQSATGYLICSGKLSASNSALAEASVDWSWFPEANDTVTNVAAPSAP